MKLTETKTPLHDYRMKWSIWKYFIIYKYILYYHNMIQYCIIICCNIISLHTELYHMTWNNIASYIIRYNITWYNSAAWYNIISLNDVSFKIILYHMIMYHFIRYCISWYNTHDTVPITMILFWLFWITFT